MTYKEERDKRRLRMLEGMVKKMKAERDAIRTIKKKEDGYVTTASAIRLETIETYLKGVVRL